MTDARERPIARTALAASALMLLWMARWIVRGEVPLTGDLLRADYPFRDFYARALAGNRRFDWMPGLLGGFDFTGASQNGGYHPAHWLLYRLLPLDIAFGIELLLPYPLAFAGMWLFLRRWCDPAASAVGAMLFAFSGFCLLHFVHVNIVTIVAHLPMLLWCIHGAVTAREWRLRARWCAGIAALTGSQLLLDHPQATWLSGLIEALYVLFLVTTRGRAAKPALRRAPALLTVGGGKLLGLAIGALQIMATVHASGHSTRAGFGRDFAYEHSMPVQYLLQLVNPYLLWGRVFRWSERADADEYAVYMGAVTLLLVVWWLGGLPARRARGELTNADRFGLSCLPLAVLGLWLATGRAGRLYTLETLIPIVNQFRVPARYTLFTNVALACTAAVGFAQLARSTPGARGMRGGTLAAWMVAAVSITVTIAMRTDGGGLPQPDSLAATMLAPSLFVIGATLLTAAARGSLTALVALVLVGAFDQAIYGLAGVKGWHEFATRAQVVQQLAEDGPLPPKGPYRLSCCPFPNVYTIAGYQMMEGYVGLTPARRLSYHSNPTLRLAQVEFVHQSTYEKSRIESAEAISREWYRLPPPLPRARFVTEVRVSAHPDEDIEMLDIEHAALAPHPLPVSQGQPGVAVITREEPGLMHVDTNTAGAQLLILSEMYEDRWTATIDGSAVPVEQVNGDFLGCVVPAGMHKVAFEFHPRYREVGGPISLAGSGATLLLAAIGFRRPHTAGSESAVLAAQRGRTLHQQ